MIVGKRTVRKKARKQENKKTKIIKIVHVQKVNLETKQDVGKL
jgi:hypothetical protein